MIAVAAMVMAACTENEMQKEVLNEQAIEFNTFAQKATRAENSNQSYSWALEAHHKAFNVFGYKNTSATAVFDNETVTNNGTAWAYAGTRYWDKAATKYCFYAYAPAAAKDKFTFNGVSGKDSQDKGYFTIASFAVTGKNIAPASGEATITDSFASGDPDQDIMIADKCELEGTTLTAYNKVGLNFIHLLSRLNIAVKKADNFNASDDASGDYITLNQIVVGHMNNSGAFDESKASGDALASGSAERWDASGDKDFDYDELDTKLTKTYNYFVETLVMPQIAEIETIDLDGTQIVTNKVETEPWIKVKYTITSGETGKSEMFEAYYNLATAFNKKNSETLAFNEGWQNTLKITISPAVIEFDGLVAPWADGENGDLTVK